MGNSFVRTIAFGCAAILFLAASTSAVTREVRVPLQDGQLRLCALPSDLRERLRLPEWASLRTSIDFSGTEGSVFVRAINAALKDGARIKVTDDAFVVRFDVDKLPHDLDEAKHATRTFTSVAAPDATANQNKLYGLLLQ